MGKYKKYKNRIEKFLSGDSGKRFFNFAYSIGAAIVILGALFKILHLPGGNFMLSVGMGVWKTSAVVRWLRLSFPLLRCSVTPQTCVPRPRVVVTTPCSSKSMSPFLRTFRKRFLLQKQNKR